MRLERRHLCLPDIAASADVSLCLFEPYSFHAFGSLGVAGRDARAPVASAFAQVPLTPASSARVKTSSLNRP